MNSPILEQHHVGDRQFALMFGYPASIRDQMLRAVFWVDAALDAGLLGHGKRLAVIGAGAAGATAAVRAASHGVETYLIELEEPFDKQRKCLTRWLDPTLYDWPACHWRSATFPSPTITSPVLSWTASYANEVALQWLAALESSRLLYPDRLTLLSPFECRTLMPVGDQVMLVLGQHGVPASVVTADAVLHATGFRAERTSLETFQSIPFWHTDGLASLASVWPADKPLRVLLSGGGDGVLQDFLRIVTGFHSPTPTYKIIESLLPPSAREKLVVWLLTAEQQCQHAYILSASESRHEHTALQQQRAVMAKLVDELTAEPSVWGPLSGALKSCSCLPSHASIHIGHWCSHWGKVYPLNHFLVELLLRCLPDQCRVWPNVSLKAVLGQGHVCDGDYWKCFGEPHEASFAAKACACVSAPLGAPPISLPKMFDVILIRHGADPQDFRDHSGARIPPPRQALPYHPIL